MRRLRNIYNLGIKELRSLLGDKAMLTLIVFAFTVSVYSSATVLPGSLHLAPIAIADMEDTNPRRGRPTGQQSDMQLKWRES